MSAFMFQMKNQTIANLSTEELKQTLQEQMKYIKECDPSNRFQCDRAGGSHWNVRFMQQELNARSYGFTGQELSVLVLREGFQEYDFVMREVVAKFNKTGESTTLEFNGSSLVIK